MLKQNKVRNSQFSRAIGCHFLRGRNFELINLSLGFAICSIRRIICFRMSGSCIYDVRAAGGVSLKADASTGWLHECRSNKGVGPKQTPKNVADVINGTPPVK